MKSPKEDLIPVFASPPRSPLLELPAELLHTIFAHLSLIDVLAARKACKTLASIGLDHFGDEVPLVYHREKFDALNRIAQHPYLAKRMRPLFYLVDRYPILDTMNWSFKASNQDPIEAGVFHFIVGQTIESPPFNENSYHAYSSISHDQEYIHDSCYDYTCLRSFFQGCYNIREVTIASKVDCYRGIGARYTAFNAANVDLDEDKDWITAGADQVCAVAHAIERCGLKLDSFTLSGISHTVFDKSTDISESRSHALSAVVRPLRRLRLFIQAVAPEYWDSSPFWGGEHINSARAVCQESLAVFEEGDVWSVLAEAQELRVLKLQLPCFSFGNTSVYPRLDRTLRDIHFLHIYEICLSQCAVKSDWLVEFLLRHKSTLGRLSLVTISLAGRQSSWRGVFT